MLSSICKRFIVKQVSSFFQTSRTFLSKAYSCNEVWNQRTNNNVFQKIDYDDLYHQLDRSFQIGSRISVLDVDLFANGIDSDSFQQELEDVLFKLRLNPETGLLSDRTMHAVVRYYMAINKKTNLIEILSDRLNYGVFPDYYASNMLMDAFLKENDNLSAAKIAVLQMLQEDLNHPILKLLSIYSCVKYLNSPDIWTLPKEPEPDPDEEETRVRVSFIRNSYFDDHFDIVDPNSLVGKTLHMAGSSLPGPIGISAQIIGLILHKKQDQCMDLLKNIMLSKAEVYEDALQKALAYVKTPPKELDDKSTDTLSGEANRSLIGLLEEALKKGNKISGDFQDAIAVALTKTVEETEPADIQSLTNTYRNWEKERSEHIAYEIAESQKRKIAAEIVKTKEDLKMREEMIFYFDKEDEWNLKVEQKLEEQKILAEEEKRIKRKDKEEEYIPPEVKQKRF